MNNLIGCLSTRRCPSEFMDVATICGHCTHDRFLDITKFTALTLPSLISCKLSFPIVGLKISSVPTLALKCPIEE
jgi:hypothetical protein